MKNALRRTLVLLMALAMLLTSLSIISLATDEGTTCTYSQGDIIEFGSYPQSEVTDETLKASLTSKAGSTDTWISYDYYQNGKKSDFMKYTDVELDGEIYRGVYFTSYRPTDVRGSSEYNFQEDNGYNTSTIYWFKYESILWQVLSYDTATETAVVLSKSTIDSQEYYENKDERKIDDKTIYANNYEYSNIRTWLNNTFYNTAFTSTEKSAIVATEVYNFAFSIEDLQNYNYSTTDNVWLLSYDEAMKAEYGFAANRKDNIGNRTANTTDYAKSQGISVDDTNNCTGWYLCTKGGPDYEACYVESDGFVYEGYAYVYKTCYGVRPALTVHLHSHEFTDIVTPATCEKGGYTTHTCSKCGETTVDTQTSPLGHNFEDDSLVDANGKLTLHCTVCDKYLTPKTGDNYNAFGSYPQTEVTDEALKASLTSKADSTDTWTSYNYYQNGKKSDFMKYTDVELDGEIYRGVYFTSYRPNGTGGDGKYSNQNYNGYNTSTIYWFKYEPISWQILSYDEATDTAVVLSKSTIDSQEYFDNTDERTINEKTIYANNYEYSNIRTWLNNTFYNTAFSIAEQTAIIATWLDNSVYKDNVWLLSYDEAQNADYGFTTDYFSTETRQAKATDYAVSQGVYVNNADKSTFWLLRSPYSSPDRAYIVTGEGNVVIDDISSTGDGVRPALTLRLKSAIAATLTVDDIVEKVENTKKSTDTAGSKIVVSSVSVSASDVYALATGISIKDKDGNDVDSTRPLATGMKITLLSGETVETSVLGDVDGDGDVDVSDARLGLRAAVKLETLTGVYEIAAKVGHDQISVSEARLILRAAVKLDNPKDWLK